MLGVHVRRGSAQLLGDTTDRSHCNRPEYLEFHRKALLNPGVAQADQSLLFHSEELPRLGEQSDARVGQLDASLSTDRQWPSCGCLKRRHLPAPVV